jgi:hypothetical protein
MARRTARGDMLRQAIAREAARLMIEHGHEDYGFVKRKAAERMGVTDLAVLPKNTEIEEALAEHQRLFAAETHPRTLAAKRAAALEAMRLLSEFEPRLVGPLLTGTATPHSDITLHVFTDTPESLVMLLLELGVPHESASRRQRFHPDDEGADHPALQFTLDGEDVEAVIFPVDGVRQAPLGPVDGRPLRRANLAEVEQLLNGAGAPLAS